MNYQFKKFCIDVCRIKSHTVALFKELLADESAKKFVEPFADKYSNYAYLNNHENFGDPDFAKESVGFELLGDMINSVFFKCIRIEERRVYIMHEELSEYHRKMLFIQRCLMYVFRNISKCYSGYSRIRTIHNLPGCHKRRLLSLISNYYYVGKVDISKFFESATSLKYLENDLSVPNDFNLRLSAAETSKSMVEKLYCAAAWNGVIPTGATYASDMADVYLIKVHKNIPNSDTIFMRYVDDIFFCSNDSTGIMSFETHKLLDEAVKKMGLNLNYKKSKAADIRLTGINILGFNIRYHKALSIESKLRREVLSHIAEQGTLPTDPSLFGKTAYYFRESANPLHFLMTMRMGYFKSHPEPFENFQQYKDFVACFSRPHSQSSGVITLDLKKRSIFNGFLNQIFPNVFDFIRVSCIYIGHNGDIIADINHHLRTKKVINRFGFPCKAVSNTAQMFVIKKDTIPSHIYERLLNGTN